MGEIRQDRQPVLRHVLPHPARIAQTAAELVVEVDHMLGPDHVGIAIDQHDRHGELGDGIAIVDRLAHQRAHGVEQLRKFGNVRRHRLVGEEHRRVLHHVGHTGADGRLLRQHLREEAVLRIGCREYHQPAHLVGRVRRHVQRHPAAEGITEDVELVVAELLYQDRKVGADGWKLDRPLAEGRAAMALQIDGDHLPVVGENRHDRREHLDLPEAAVKQQQRFALAADLVIIINAVDRHASLPDDRRRSLLLLDRRRATSGA